MRLFAAALCVCASMSFVGGQVPVPVPAPIYSVNIINPKHNANVPGNFTADVAVSGATVVFVEVRDAMNRVIDLRIGIVDPNTGVANVQMNSPPTAHGTLVAYIIQGGITRASDAKGIAVLP